MKLNWLDNKPYELSGITWGVPWQRGVLDRKDSLALLGQSGNRIPLQSWPMAYWPDGSIKWTGHAAVIADDEEAYEVTKGTRLIERKSL